MHEIAQILTKAKAQRWPYPKTFQALKNIGVESYVVSLLEGIDAIYQGSFGVWIEAVPSDYISQGFDVDGSFYPSEIQAAILKHVQKKTSYLEFLRDIAASGVASYIVDMQAATVTYFNIDKTQSYQEIVPIWEAIDR